MSAYVVDDITINRILAGVEHLYRNDRSSVNPAFRGIGYNLDDHDDLARLGQDLFNLNVRSVQGLYNDPSPASELPGRGHEAFHYLPLKPDLRQSLESLSCWAYQSCEGDCDKDPLFVVMDHDVQIALMTELIDRYAPKPAHAWE